MDEGENMAEDHSATPPTGDGDPSPNSDGRVTPEYHPGAPEWVTPGAPTTAPSTPVPGYAPPGYPSDSPPPPPPGPPTGPAYGARSQPEQLNAAPSFRSWQPGIIPLRPLSFGDFLTVPFKAIRYNRAVVLGAPLIFTLLSTILVLTTVWVVLNDPQLGLLSPFITLSGISAQSLTMIVVSLLAVLLADMLSSSVIAPGVARAILGERIKISLAWKQVRRRLGSLLLLYIASATILMLLLVLAVLPSISAVVAQEPEGTGNSLTLVLVLTVFFPSALLVTLFQGVARAMIVLEGITMSAALARVLRLIRGRFWWSILIVLVTGVLINIVSSVLQSVGQFVTLIVVLVSPASLTAIAISIMVVVGLTYVVSLVIVYSYLGSVFALLYTDLRMRREGFDLDLARAAEERARR